MGVVGTLFTFALKQGYVDRNVVRDLPREDRPSAARASEPRYLSADELALLLAHAKDDYRPLLALWGYAALRLGESLGLRWALDLDFDADR